MPRPIKYTERVKEKHIIGLRRSDLPILCSRCSISVHCYDTCLVSGLKWWDIDLAADGTGFFHWSRFSHLSRLLWNFLRPRWEVMDPRLIHRDKSIQKIRYIVLKLRQHSIETYSKYSLCFIVSKHDSILRGCLIKDRGKDEERHGLGCRWWGTFIFFGHDFPISVHCYDTSFVGDLKWCAIALCCRWSRLSLL